MKRSAGEVTPADRAVYSTATVPQATTTEREAAADMAHAIETFARGFSLTRSFTHPCLAERVGPLWLMRDASRKRAADYRREQWVAHGVSPEVVDRTARQHARGHFVVCAVRAPNEPDGPLRVGYKSLGYRLHGTEPFFVHRLRRIPRPAEPVPMRRVTTQSLADALAKAARARQVLPEHLRPDSPIRLYAALDRERPIGWVKSVTVADASWVSSMYVEPAYRRRGIGRSLLARMLRDDRSAGLKRSVLLASHTGALLYPRVGYEQIGELLVFTPRKTPGV